MVDLASPKTRNKQKPLKRKPEDELPLPKKAVETTEASSAADVDHGDYDELDDGAGAERPQRNSRENWLEESLWHSSDSLEEVVGEDPEEVVEGDPEEVVEDVEQGEKGTDKGEDLDTEDPLSLQGIGKPRISNQTWESNESTDPILYIYTLNEAGQLQIDLENLESELLVTRDKTPWDKFKRKLCDPCKAAVDGHLEIVKRRRPKDLVPDKLDRLKTRPSLGSSGGFGYFLGLPTLEELATKQRDIETLRMMRPIRQKLDWAEVEPKLCVDCDKYRKRAKVRAPAPHYLKPFNQSRPSAAAPKPPPKGKTPIFVSSDPEDRPVHERAEQLKQEMMAREPAPTSVPEQSELPVPIDQPKIQPKAVKPTPAIVPGPSKPPVQTDPRKIQPKAVKPVPATVPGPSQSTVATDLPQKAPPKDAPPKKVTDEPQPPAQADRPKRKGPAPKTIAPEDPQPHVQAQRPKRKGPDPKQVAPKELQRPPPGGKLKKKDPTPGPSAPKKAEPIQPAAAEKPSKKPGLTHKKNIPDPPHTSPEPATQEVKKAEDHIEEVGPIQRVMGNLPEKPKGHDYYCAICYTNLTRMGSAKKLEHVENCGTTLGEVKVMTKAQAQAAKAGK